MKLAVQVTTNNLGDIVVEEIEEKSTTNPEDQRAILVELLYKALYKITASYKIPKEMLDLGDEEYIDANTRHQEQQKEAKPSSAERNRQLRESISETDTDTENTEGHYCDDCPVDNCCAQSDTVDDQDQNQESNEEFLVINEEEIPAIERFLEIYRDRVKKGIQIDV